MKKRISLIALSLMFGLASLGMAHEHEGGSAPQAVPSRIENGDAHPGVVLHDHQHYDNANPAEHAQGAATHQGHQEGHHQGTHHEHHHEHHNNQ